MATRPQRRLPNLTKFLTLAIQLNAHIHGFFHAIGLPFAIMRIAGRVGLQLTIPVPRGTFFTAMMSHRLEELVRELERSRKALLKTLSSFTQAELDASPSPSAGAWSAAEILHHLQLIEIQLTRILSKQIERAEKMGIGPDLSGESLMHSPDAYSVATVTDGISAPQSVAPTKGMGNQELLEGLARSRRALLQKLEEGSARYTPHKKHLPVEPSQRRLPREHPGQCIEKYRFIRRAKPPGKLGRVRHQVPGRPPGEGGGTFPRVHQRTFGLRGAIGR